MRTMSSQEFNRDSGKAKRAATDGPVVVTERGEPSHVLLTWADYLAAIGAGSSIGDLLGDPASADVDLPLPDRTPSTRQPVDLEH